VKHNKYDYVKKVVDAGLAVLLTGEAGTGKTTIAKQIAADRGTSFYAMSMTKQTSVNAIIGFISINGTYIPSQFRQAFEYGGLFLLDELDAADPNVLLVLNTIENGYIAFPDGVITVHEDFRLIATANPQDEHNIYTGRSKLDFSTMDRFYEVKLPRDGSLEESLTSERVTGEANFVRTLLKDNGSSIKVTMRDAIRIHKLYNLGIDEDPLYSVVFHKDSTLNALYKKEKGKIEEAVKKAKERKAKEEAEAKRTQADAKSIDELWEFVQKGK